MILSPPSIKEKNKIKQEAFKFLYTFGKNIKAKFDNVCGKTGQYDVPDELFQKRTSRKNRVLISWKTVRACLKSRCVRIFKHNFAEDKEKIRRHTVVWQGFLT